MTTLSASLNMTIEECDAMDDYSELDYLLSLGASHLCDDLTLIDDTKGTSHRKLYYVVNYPRITGFADRDEEGSYPDTEAATEQISVKVTPGMSLKELADEIENEVRGLDGNYFSR